MWAFIGAFCGLVAVGVISLVTLRIVFWLLARRD